MKRVLSLVAVCVLLCLMMIGADFRFHEESSRQDKRKCFGYTVVEAGKGIDCNGDTIKLIRRQGYFELAALNN